MRESLTVLYVARNFAPKMLNQVDLNLLSTVTLCILLYNLLSKSKTCHSAETDKGKETRLIFFSVCGWQKDVHLNKYIQQ